MFTKFNFLFKLIELVFVIIEIGNYFDFKNKGRLLTDCTKTQG